MEYFPVGNVTASPVLNTKTEEMDHLELRV
jgi:hypothetical protein